MDADDLVDAINDSHNNAGPVYVHVVDRDHEYWLEVTEIKDTNLIEVPWANGILIETKPIPDGVRATKEIFTPRPYFQPIVVQELPDEPVDLPEEFAVAAHIEDLACKSPEQLNEMAATGELKAVYGIGPADTPDARSYPITSHEIELSGTVHTPLHGRMYETDQLFANPHMQDPKLDQSEPHYWTYENAPEFKSPAAIETPTTEETKE